MANPRAARRSRAAALFTAAILVLAACGSSPAKPVDPVGGMNAAFDAAKSGGTLASMDLVTCLTTGGQIGGAFSGFMSGFTGDALAKAGITSDDLTAAWKIRFDDLKTTEVSESGTTAVVNVKVKVTTEIDAGRMRELVKKFSATQGIVPDDATIDAAIKAQLGGQNTMSITLDKDISVVEENGNWVACRGSLVAAGATPTAGTTTAATAAPAAPAITEPPTPAPTSAPPGAGGVPATGRATMISAGTSHVCALLTDGRVTCWGDNTAGQLGSGSTSKTDATVEVVGLGSGVKSIAARSDYTCALSEAGAVKCWGTGASGALGNGSTNVNSLPIDVAGLPSGVTSIVAGGLHTCALTSGGAVMCWGQDGYGQLGDGSTTNSGQPVNASVLPPGIRAIAAGTDHTCALTSAGGVECWGNNSAGQLGDGTKTDSLAPVDVVGLTSGVTAIVAGYRNTCALTSTGGVKCWGGLSSVPVDVVGLASGITAIDSSLQATCAHTTGDDVKCWGADGAVVNIRDQAGLPDPDGVIAVSLGTNVGCVLWSDGGVQCSTSGTTWTPVVVAP